MGYTLTNVVKTTKPGAGNEVWSFEFGVEPGRFVIKFLKVLKIKLN